MTILKDPVIVVGAPRSGTTLLFKIIREHNGFISLAKESDIIWNKYCHPENNNWEHDGWSSEYVTPEVIEDIRKQFIQYSVPAEFWRTFSKVGILSYRRYPALSFPLRQAYKTFAKLRAYLPRSAGDYRLVEKSVDAAFKINLIDKIFPDARYLYITRNGIDTVRSMMYAWLDPNRFFTYKLPLKIEIPDYPYERWNFSLPEGWREYIDRPLHEVVAFQWIEMHRSIKREFAKNKYNGRVFRFPLEALQAEPERMLSQICDFSQIEWDSHFDFFAKNLPMVNARNNKDQSLNIQMQDLQSIIASTNAELGYD